MLQIKLVILFTVLGLITGCTSFPRIYSGDEIHGWVIDSKTKQPIKDVVVVEIWKLRGGMHVDHTANIHIAETVTDENGYYEFSNWGPRFTMSGWMDRSSPFLKFYKFGYLPAHRMNRIGGRPILDYSESEHSGKKIKLEKFEGVPKEYQKKLGSIYGILQTSHYRSSFDCVWVNIPMFTFEMIKVGEYFRKNRVGTGFPSLTSLPDPGCENPEEILKGYLK